MSSSNTSDEQVNYATLVVNDNIQRGLADGTMTEDELIIFAGCLFIFKLILSI